MISVLRMGVWFIAVSNHMKKRGRCQRQLPQKQRVMLMGKGMAVLRSDYSCTGDAVRVDKGTRDWRWTWWWEEAARWVG